jgi:hypothetical protein
MTHLGILQQFSLEEKTNVLKHIKSYEDNIPENNNNNYLNENDILKKSDLEKKSNINIKDLSNKLSENKIDDKHNKKDLDINIIKHEKINNKYNLNEEIKNEETEHFEEKSEINDIYKIFKNKEKIISNLNNNKLKKKDKNIIKNESEIINNNNVKLNDLENKQEKNDIWIEDNIQNTKLNILKEQDDLFKNDFMLENDNFEFKLNNEDMKFKENENNSKEKEEKKSNIKIINQEKKNDNFICDLDIFKKLQIQMNKKSEILQKTIDKYNHKPKKFEIINDSKLNQNDFSNYPKEQNINNDKDIFKNKNDLNINSTSGIDIKEINEKMNYNTKNLLEKINRIKNNIDKTDNLNINQNKYNKSNKINNDKDKDMFIKKEIKSAQSSYEPLIFRIPSLLLDDKIEEIEIYIKLEMIYYNLKTITSKLDFISLLRQVLNNVIMLKNSSFNVFMTLFNFILSLQIYELNQSDCNPSLPCEYLKSLLDLLVNNKDLSDMIRIIIVLIKKYFPINMGIILEQKNIVTLKVLNSYLKQLNNVILSAYINIKSVFIEINDFLFFSPPSLLSDEYPLAELYMEIYQEIRNTTDNVIKSCRSKMMKNELMEAVVFIKTKIKNSSVDYVKYLDYAIYKIN